MPVPHPPRTRTLGALLDEMAAATPAAEAVIDGPHRVSYAELRDRVDDCARALLALGVGHGDRVALLMPNQVEWVVSALAIGRIGAITCAISTFSTPRELAWTLEHSGAMALITCARVRGNDFLAALAEIDWKVALPELRAVVCVDPVERTNLIGWKDFLTSGGETSKGQLRAAADRVMPEDICYILYTSGSTAAPKGVTLAHGNVIANGFDIGERMHLTPADRVWFAVPLFWSFGSANAFPALLSHGGCLVLQEAFEPGRALELIEDERCTVFYGMANMARALAEHPAYDRARMVSMRTGLTIGLPEDVELMIDVLDAPELCNVYGSTETYGNCAVTDAHDPLELRLTTQGEPLPGMDFKVIDRETGEPLPEGETGELCVRGYITPGYFRAPELNAETFDEDGYFHTGDLGRIDANGRINFKGRLKELIKTGGVNVSPLEVEQVLSQHPSVKQVHVVGIADTERGELVAAVIEPHVGAATDVASLTAHCREHLSRYKVPTIFDFRQADEFPRTPTGKIHKPGLREELAGKR